MQTQLNTLYSPKQQEVLDFAVNNSFFLLINGGAKRSGKTVVDNDIFLLELLRVRQQADLEGVKNPQYILAGADLSSVQRNVLIELTNKYGIEFKFDKFNRFRLFGVTVCCFGHSKINDLGRIRGMTAWGAYINEGTLANKKVFGEIISRCSAPGARIIMDTNPAAPSNFVKKDYVDKADGKTIVYFGWKLTDNTFVSEQYIENIKKSTPSGATYDRDINGAWVAQAGICFPDFNRSVNYITAANLPTNFDYYFCGKDFGWEHKGALCLCGKAGDTIYILKTWCKKYRSIEEWIEIIHSNIINKKVYGDPVIYCDSARPDLIQKMQIAGLRAVNAKKDVAAGIACVDSLYKQCKLLVVTDSGEGAEEFDTEIDTYCWKENAEEPVKEQDDMMDAVRYAVYTDSIFGEV